jgi:hypothetical protein
MRPLLLVLLAILATEHWLQAQNIQMTSWSQILANGGRVSWSVNNVIAYDHQGAPGTTGYFNVYTMTTSGGSQTCLTCSGSPGASVLAGLNSGNPVWTPDGNFVIFQSQNGPSLGNYTLDFPGFPGEGAWCDLWATDTAGHFWQLTNQGSPNGTSAGGVIYPTFSWDGTKLAWGQRLTIGTPPADPGEWELAVAAFSETGGVPSISTPAYYQPGAAPGYYEPRSFSLDNTTVFFMGDKETAGMNTYARNIYSFNLGTQVLFNLTKTLVNWNEYPLALPASPFGANKIVYMLYPQAGSGNPNCISDYWVMNYDGTDNYQLTFFNTPGNPNYQSAQSVCMDDHSFSPNATQMVAFPNYFAANGHTGAPGPIWILNMADVAVVNSVSSGAFPGSGLYPGSGLQ